jgi:hypothetical protein
MPLRFNFSIDDLILDIVGFEPGIASRLFKVAWLSGGWPMATATKTPWSKASTELRSARQIATGWSLTV